MASVRDRISVLLDLFMGAAFADARLLDKERDYVRDLVLDLLNATALPAEVETRIAAFDPAGFDLGAAAAEFLRDPPMSRRRLLELVAYVTLADGAQNAAEDSYLRALGEALSLPPDEYQDLTMDRIKLRDSFIELARVPLPESP